MSNLLCNGAIQSTQMLQIDSKNKIDLFTIAMVVENFEIEPA